MVTTWLDTSFDMQFRVERVAQEFGDHPETAVVRMRWARAVARKAFADSAPDPGPRADADPLPAVRPRRPAEQTSGSPGGGCI